MICSLSWLMLANIVLWKQLYLINCWMCHLYLFYTKSSRYTCTLFKMPVNLPKKAVDSFLTVSRGVSIIVLFSHASCTTSQTDSWGAPSVHAGLMFPLLPIGGGTNWSPCPLESFDPGVNSDSIQSRCKQTSGIRKAAVIEKNTHIWGFALN